MSSIEEFWRASFAQRASQSRDVKADEAADFADTAVRRLLRMPDHPSGPGCPVLVLDDQVVPVADGHVRVGGRAQVLRYEAPAEGEPPNPLDEGWSGPWTEQHELSVSSFLDVVLICLPGNGVVLGNGLSYPPSCLVALVD